MSFQMRCMHQHDTGSPIYVFSPIPTPTRKKNKEVGNLPADCPMVKIDSNDKYRFSLINTHQLHSKSSDNCSNDNCLHS